MTKARLQVFVLAASVAALGVASAVARGGDGGTAPDTTLEVVGRYRQWGRVTTAPVPVEFASVAG
jgi:hypothetical protein